MMTSKENVIIHKRPTWGVTSYRRTATTLRCGLQRQSWRLHERGYEFTCKLHSCIIRNVLYIYEWKNIIEQRRTRRIQSNISLFYRQQGIVIIPFFYTCMYSFFLFYILNFSTWYISKVILSIGCTFKVLHNLSKVQRQGVFNNSNDMDDIQNYNNFIITIFKAKPAIKKW